VVTLVFAAVCQFKIAWFVVGLVAVPVVDDIGASQWSADSPRYDEAVLKRVPLSVGQWMILADEDIRIPIRADVTPSTPCVGVDALAPQQVLACEPTLSCRRHGFKGITQCH
jgi:hypothetical protein